MQSNVDKVKEVIEQDIWGLIQDFLNITIYPLTGDKADGIHITVGVVLLVIFAFVVTTIALRLIRVFLTRKLEENDKLKFISVFKFIKYLVYIIVIIITLSSAGIDITILLTASAVLFVGLGLALQELFQDVIGGLFIIVDKSLLVGDIIEMEGRVGRVIDIKLRTTRVLTRDDKVMIIPNHKFISDILFNYTQNHKTTREFVKVGVAYGSDTERVQAILLECAREQTGIVKKPEPFVIFDDFGDSSLDFSLHFFVTDSFVDPKIKSLLRFKIDHKFRLNGISIPFPQRDVHMFYPSNASAPPIPPPNDENS
ncbi:mechanosensitive ion channel-like protein [Gillisia mitskevichiae]|uniref:Mechanosensitive ion channel-like protein n=1 Tax=Gillisia mitskevichiae TaxID=270921 RepID=A0A495P4E5_9FLAO|nr:mechanosensitive ion channel domain-containing protein [Gillisia mitskevichiae]RKS45087.1 mechanosensitive ion channel-like protein [Gillisia mitskevichiae]